ncbi:hypothetical protein BKA62DRAFT_713125 [Auriculariales sp. MPI-PUGE-AT-0066]|nr:hypothetical protein BKA62DRAFT_713125 [Auriculariales sp. MPI-PUGE-AT-0066]
MPPTSLQNLAPEMSLTPASAISQLPGKVLGEIFNHSSMGWPDDDVPGFLLRVNTKRAHLPFQLASVCQRWRTACLEAPFLWQYIVIENRRHSKSTRAYVDLMVARSQGKDLDIYFEYAAGWYAESYELVFDALIEQRNRWHRVVALLSQGLTSHFLHLFCAETPRLRTLQLSVQALPDNADTFQVAAMELAAVSPVIFLGDAFLSSAPNLHCLTLVNVPIVLEKWSLDRHSQFKMLELIQRQIPERALWPLLRNHPELEWLFLGCFLPEMGSDVTDGPQEPVDLPVLDSLWLQKEAAQLFVRHPTILNLPVLNELTLRCYSYANLSPFFGHLSSTTTLRDLYLTTLLRLTDGDIDALAALERVQTVRCWAIIIPATLLQRLMAHAESKEERIMWPMVTGLEIGPTFEDDVVSSNLVVALAQMRRERRVISKSPGGAETFRWQRCLVSTSAVLPADQMTELEAIRNFVADSIKLEAAYIESELPDR